MSPDEVVKRTILRGVVGSTAHGIATGTDDRDEMGVCIEPPEYVVGLSNFEQYIFRTAEQREPRKDGKSPRSQPGDLDLTIYSLRKWANLAGKGNPSVLTLLYLPEEHIVSCTSLGRELRSKASMFVSKESGRRFLGYLRGQRQRLVGERGQKDVKRPELTEKYGYDTKYAGHMLRLGMQGIELMESGKLVLPLPWSTADSLKAVRMGRYSLGSVMAMGDEIEKRLEHSIESSQLPDHADWNEINKWLVAAYLSNWNVPAW